MSPPAGDLHMAGSTSRDSGLKETVTLKWCTPRTNSVGRLSADTLTGDGVGGGSVPQASRHEEGGLA